MSDSDDSDDGRERESNAKSLRARLPYLGLGEGEAPPVNIETVFAALVEIQRSKSREWIPGPHRDARHHPLHGELGRWIEVDRPDDHAVRVLTRALQTGKDHLIVRALELAPVEKGRILARRIAWQLCKPKGELSWDDPEAMRKKYRTFTAFSKGERRWDDPEVIAEWISPAKADVEDVLRDRYAEIYKLLPMKNGAGGKRLSPAFWRGAGLEHLRQAH